MDLIQTETHFCTVKHRVRCLWTYEIVSLIYYSDFQCLLDNPSAYTCQYELLSIGLCPGRNYTLSWYLNIDVFLSVAFTLKTTVMCAKMLEAFKLMTWFIPLGQSCILWHEITAHPQCYKHVVMLLHNLFNFLFAIDFLLYINIHNLSCLSV
jgi:hypothetical protein